MYRDNDKSTKKIVCLTALLALCLTVIWKAAGLFLKERAPSGVANTAWKAADGVLSKAAGAFGGAVRAYRGLIDAMSDEDLVAVGFIIIFLLTVASLACEIIGRNNTKKRRYR